MRTKALAVLVSMSAVMSACASDKLVGRPGLTIVQNDNLPAPTLADADQQRREYRIAPGDKLNVVTYGIDDLSPRDLLVDAQGSIGMPLAGTIPAAGRTPDDLARQIEAALRARFVRMPRVTVGIVSTSQLVTVDGEVREPGLYPVLGRMTLIRAVASAKGVTEFADTNYVVVFRNVGNRKMAALYDLRAIRQGIYADPEIYPNDVVTVGESAGRRVFQTIIQGSALLVAPIVALLN